MENSAFISLNDVDYTYSDDGTTVLKDISLRIRKGAFVALVGMSGIGKSTLLRLIGGLLVPSRGEVLLSGRPSDEAGAPVGIVFQRDSLMPWRTAYDNVRLPLELSGVNGREADQRVYQILKLVGLQGFERSYPAQLSGGMAQRVAIARALIHQPELLLLDEPFGSLDALTRERMAQELLRIWQAMPVTVFMVTHSISEAVFLADEVLVLGSTGKNGHPAKITEHIPVDIPRPRDFDDRQEPTFQSCEAAVRAAIVA